MSAKHRKQPVGPRHRKQPEPRHRKQPEVDVPRHRLPSRGKKGIYVAIATAAAVATASALMAASWPDISGPSTVTTFMVEPTQLDPTPSRSYQPERKRKRASRSAVRSFSTATPTATPSSSSSPSASRTFSSTPKPPSLNPKRWDVIEYAKAEIGEPYVWGATGPDSYDCSGLVMWAFARAGLDMPRVSGDQARMGNVTSVWNLSPGDLVAWSGHVAIWLGGGRIIEAARPGTTVRIREFGNSFDAGAWGVSLDYSELPRL